MARIDMANLDHVIAHLGAALMQSISSDDQIIMDHVREAERIAKVLRAEMKSLSMPSQERGSPK